MNLKLNSWYVWLWDYTYSEKVPNNLCPLFWKLVVAILLFIPNVIFRIPIVIVNLFQSKYNKIITARTGLGIFAYFFIAATIFVLYSIYNYLLWLFGAYSYDSGAVACGGIVLCVGLFFLIRYFWLKKNVGYAIEKTATDNIVVNYASSWYNKHCPKITWK
jgi:hypothetical protein